MLGRIASAIAVLTTLSVISVPAQQPTASTRFAPMGVRALGGPPASAFSAVQGAALKADNSPFSGARLRLRDARAGRIVLKQQADDEGLFRFRPLDRGSYVVELLADERTVLAASSLLSLDAGEVAQTVVREPGGLDELSSLAGFADAHASAVQAAAAASGILVVRPGDHVSPR